MNVHSVSLGMHPTVYPSLSQPSPRPPAPPGLSTSVPLSQPSSSSALEAVVPVFLRTGTSPSLVRPDNNVRFAFVTCSLAVGPRRWRKLHKSK